MSLTTSAAESYPVKKSPDGFSKDNRFIVDLIYKCYEKMKRVNRTRNGTDFCPVAFDGYSCWDATPLGETAHIPCPYFVTGFDPTRLAFRQCLENGSWFVHPESGKEWSNYTTCIDVEDLEFRQVVNKLYIAGYSISVLTLLVSLLIFLSFRSLRCTRIFIHVQLFTSFTINNLMWIAWYRLVVDDAEVVRENKVWCQVLHVAVHYFMVSNYMWMFCEGLHLHIALVVVFAAEKVVMRWFHVIGWAVPLVLTAAYATVRADTADSTGCWMHDSLTTWVLAAPVCVSMVASLFFLVNVVRVLITKLHRESVPVGIRKAVRATLILVPLFGIQYVLLPFRPLPGEPGERVYQIVAAVVTSMQGCCVSCLFCFANVDVHCAVRRMFFVLSASKDTLASVQDGATQSHTRDVHV